MTAADATVGVCEGGRQNGMDMLSEKGLKEVQPHALTRSHQWRLALEPPARAQLVERDDAKDAPANSGPNGRPPQTHGEVQGGAARRGAESAGGKPKAP